MIIHKFNRHVENLQQKKIKICKLKNLPYSNENLSVNILVNREITWELHHPIGKFFHQSDRMH